MGAIESIQHIPSNMWLPIGKIRLDGGTQIRVALSDAVIARYVEAIKEGVTFPPVVVFRSNEDDWLADGFHRIASYERAGEKFVLADVRHGSQRDAILYACGANDDHGETRTKEDKRRAVMRLLEDPEWSKWSDREIAKACRVGHAFVSRLRPSLSTGDSDHRASQPEPRSYRNKHGTVSTMNVANIGRANGGDDHDELPQPAPIDASTESPDTESMSPQRRRGGGVTRDHERWSAVQQLTADGFTVWDIAEKTGYKKAFIHNVRREIAPKKSVFEGVIQDAEVFAEMWQMRAEDIDPRWIEAPEEEVENLIRALDACVDSIKAIKKRLNKEAAKRRPVQ